MIASHLRVPWMIGAGWAGVVVFFVLSGYLITGLLMAERERTGRIRLGAFYLRRAGRLVPELVAMVAAVTFFALLAGAPDAFTNAVVALTYTDDFVNMNAVRIGQLSHTWTLAVEEQFYLLWPVALLLVVRFASWRTVAVVAVLAALWRAGMAADGWNWNRYAFGPDAQLDGLMAGAALALSGRTWQPSRRWVAAGIALILAASVSQWAFGTGAQATFGVPMAVVGALLLIARGGAAWKPLAVLGLVSYSVYLWHLPLLEGAWTLLGRSVPSTMLGLVATGIVAPVSYRLALPIREWAKRRSRRLDLADVRGHVRARAARAAAD